jgi:phosphatidylserine/phosphatidylglycerophosphate/cardiolipin synthase-like enzyme
MHHKFMAIDGKIVVTGSYNFSVSAEDANDENLIVLIGEEIAALYSSEFMRVWMAAQP